MRNDYQTKISVARNQKRDTPNLVCAIAFVVIALWSGQSHASNLWLWAWLGVAEIQVTQNVPNSPCKAKATLTSIALTKSTTPEPVKSPVKPAGRA